MAQMMAGLTVVRLDLRPPKVAYTNSFKPLSANNDLEHLNKPTIDQLAYRSVRRSAVGIWGRMKTREGCHGLNWFELESHIVSGHRSQGG